QALANSRGVTDFSGLELRVLMIMGEPWFAGADLRRALGISTHGRWNASLGNDETQTIRECGEITFKGHGLTVVSESGLYKLIMRSDKPEARKFQDWVTREVLPAIRK